MTFKDLGDLLKTMFQETSHTGNLKHKTYLKNLCITQLSQQKNSWWKSVLLGKFSTQINSGIASVLVFVSIFSVFQNQSYAGELEPTFGLIEITRDGKTKIIREKTKLKVGDIVEISSSAEANIVLKNDSVESKALAHTELTILDKNKIFLSEGTLENAFNNQAEIATKRGKISGKNGKGVIAVSQTGETKIIATENNITVSDWLDRSTNLSDGEIIKLSTDTNLGNTKPNIEKKALTNKELKKIEAKLLITRTKTLNGILKINNKDVSGREDLAAAEKSFKTIYSYINEYFSGKKTDHSQISKENVVEIVLQRIPNQSIQTETKAIFTLLEKAQNDSVVFSIQNNENKNYEKFQIIENIFETYAPEQRQEKKILQNKYITQAQTELIDLQTETARQSYISKIPQRTYFRNELENLLVE